MTSNRQPGAATMRASALAKFAQARAGKQIEVRHPGGEAFLEPGESIGSSANRAGED